MFTTGAMVGFGVTLGVAVGVAEGDAVAEAEAIKVAEGEACFTEVLLIGGKFLDV